MIIIIKAIPCNNPDECVTNVQHQLESNGIANTGVVALGIVILFITFVAILVGILQQKGLSQGEPEEPREPPPPPPQSQPQPEKLPEEEEGQHELVNSTKGLIIFFVIF